MGVGFRCFHSVVIMSFYVTLPSDSSMKYYPNNTVTRFRTQLASNLSLPGSWEVGMAEVAYPHSWFNVGGGCSIRLRKGNLMKAISLDEGYYKNVDRVIKELQLPPEYGVDLYYKKAINRTMVRLTVERKKDNTAEERVQVEMSPQLCNILGFDYYSSPVGGPDSSTSYYTNTSVYGEYPPNLDPIKNLFIYTDIIPPQHVGDTMVPLIRCVRVKGDHSDYVEKIYDRPHYIKLAQNNISSIEIDIRDDRGNPVLFTDGKSQVKLHFRRSRND